MSYRMDCFGLSHPGVVRDTNEDQFLIADLSKSMLVRQTSLPTDDYTRLFGGHQAELFVVADGMGGVAGGRRASGVAVQSLARYVLETMPWFLRLRADDAADPGEELKAALVECQKRVEEAAAVEAGHGKMGTTLTLAYVLWPRAYVVHAGDSRCYLVRDGQLHQITRDHTVAQRLADEGAIPAAEIETSRWSHVLWNCLGGGTHDVFPELSKAVLRPGDGLLLCSDGLCKYVAEDVIAGIMGQGSGAEAQARLLVGAALEAGGRDNVTVIVAHFRDPDTPHRTSGPAEATLELRR